VGYAFKRSTRRCVTVAAAIVALGAVFCAPAPAFAQQKLYFSVAQERTSKDHVIVEKPRGTVSLEIVGINGFKYKNAMVTTTVQALAGPDFTPLLGNIQNMLPLGQIFAPLGSWWKGAVHPGFAVEAARTALKQAKVEHRCDKGLDFACARRVVELLESERATILQAFETRRQALSKPEGLTTSASSTVDKAALMPANVDADKFARQFSEVVLKQYPVAVRAWKQVNDLGDGTDATDCVLGPTDHFSFDCVKRFQKLELAEFRRTLTLQSKLTPFEYERIKDALEPLDVSAYAQDGLAGSQMRSAYAQLKGTLDDLLLGESSSTAEPVSQPKATPAPEPGAHYKSQFVLEATGIGCAKGLGFNGLSTSISVRAEARQQSKPALAQDIVTIDCPSRFAVSAGAGYSTLPNIDYQAQGVLAIVNGKPVIDHYVVAYKVNSRARTVGAALAHFDVASIGGGSGAPHLNLTAGVGASKSSIDLLYGFSVAFGKRAFLNVVEHVGSVTQLHPGFFVAQTIPANFSPPTQQLTTTKLAWLLTISTGK